MASLSGERRRAVFQRDDYTCVYCGERFDEAELTVDHVEPVMRGGDDSPGNLVTACTPCNTRKAGRAAWLYLQDRPADRQRFLERATAVWPRLRRAVVEAAGRYRERS